jgi:hypothetical protein
MLYFYEVSSRKEIFVLSHFSKLEGHLGFSIDVQVIAGGKWVGNHPQENLASWNELATTSAPIQDEAVQAVLGMNQKTHPLPLTMDFLAPFSAPKNFPSYLLPPSYMPPHPTSILPTSPLLLAPPSYLPSPSYLPHLISHSLHH